MYYYAISSDVIGDPNLHSSPRYFLVAMILVFTNADEHTHVLDELLAVTATFSLVEDRTTVDRHVLQMSSTCLTCITAGIWHKEALSQKQQQQQDELLSIRFGSNGVILGWHNPRALSHDHCLLFVLSAVLSLCF